MADVYLLDRNRGSLKTIFARHCADTETLQYAEMLKFATAARIYPVIDRKDLVSSLELKRLFYKAADRFSIDDPRVELSYLQFEKLLKLISSHCFSLELPPADRVQLLIAHIQTHCQAHYKVPLQSGSMRRTDSFDCGLTPKPVLRKQQSMSGLSPTRKASKPQTSLSRLTANQDSASTERVSTSRAKALTQKVQRLYQMMTPRARRPELKLKSKAAHKSGLSVESPRYTADRLLSMPDSTRRLSDMLSSVKNSDRRQTDSSVKLASPLQVSFSENGTVVEKIRRALANLEIKTDLAMRRTKLEGRRKYAAKRLTEMHIASQEKVTRT